MLERYFIFAKDLSIKTKVIFYAMFIPIIALAYNMGIALATSHPKVRYITKSTGELATETVSSSFNVVLGIAIGIMVTGVLIYLWKLLFEKFLIHKIEAMGTINITNKSNGNGDSNENDGNPRKNIVLSKFFELGQSPVHKVITLLFYTGIGFIILHGLFMSGFAFFLPRIAPFRFQLWHFIGLLFGYTIGIIIWKVICELLLVVFRCLETYYQSKVKEL